MVNDQMKCTVGLCPWSVVLCLAIVQLTASPELPKNGGARFSVAAALHMARFQSSGCSFHCKLLLHRLHFALQADVIGDKECIFLKNIRVRDVVCGSLMA